MEVKKQQLDGAKEANKPKAKEANKPKDLVKAAELADTKAKQALIKAHEASKSASKSLEMARKARQTKEKLDKITVPKSTKKIIDKMSTKALLRHFTINYKGNNIGINFSKGINGEKIWPKLVTLDKLFPKSEDHNNSQVILCIVEGGKKTYVKRGEDGKYRDAFGKMPVLSHRAMLNIARTPEHRRAMLAKMTELQPKQEKIMVAKDSAEDKHIKNLKRGEIRKLFKDRDRLKKFFLKKHTADNTHIVDFKGNPDAEKMIGIKHMFGPKPALIKVITSKQGDPQLAEWKNGDYRYVKTGKRAVIWQGYSLWLPGKNELASFKKEANKGRAVYARRVAKQKAVEVKKAEAIKKISQSVEAKEVVAKKAVAKQKPLKDFLKGLRLSDKNIDALASVLFKADENFDFSKNKKFVDDVVFAFETKAKPGLPQWKVGVVVYTPDQKQPETAWKIAVALTKEKNTKPAKKNAEKRRMTALDTHIDTSKFKKLRAMQGTAEQVKRILLKYKPQIDIAKSADLKFLNACAEAHVKRPDNNWGYTIRTQIENDKVALKRQAEKATEKFKEKLVSHIGKKSVVDQASATYLVDVLLADKPNCSIAAYKKLADKCVSEYQVEALQEPSSVPANSIAARNLWKGILAKV